MKKLLEFLDGKKTFIGVGLGAIYSILIWYGVVESNPMIWTAIASWTGVSFRLAQSGK